MVIGLHVYADVRCMHDGWNIMFSGFDSVYDNWCIHDCIDVICFDGGICLIVVDLSCCGCGIYW